MPGTAIETKSASGEPTCRITASVLTPGRWMATMVVLTGASLFALLVCLQFGVERIGFAETIEILARALRDGDPGAESAGSTGVILLQVRLPRLLLGFLVGGCLAVVGAALQALLRNPLADPYVLGLSSGAALGVSVALVFGLGTVSLALPLLPLSAFAGSLLSILLVYRVAVSYGHLPVHTLLLAGVVLNTLFSALIMFATSLIDPAQSFRIISWLMGTLSALDYQALAVLTLYSLVGGVLLIRQAWPLNLLTLGEETARSLGVEVEQVKRRLFFIAALLTGAVVSVSGLIGFVGMAVPHAVRMVIGADHRLLMPASVLVGGTFLVAADTVARTALAPAEIPVGVVTALVGAPFFLYLLISRKGGMV